MSTKRKTAIIVGALFLIAMVTSLGGGLWLESILTAPDYLLTVSANETQVIIGVLLELINCVAVIGIAVMMFPIFKKTDEALALGYVAFRVVEAAILVAAVISPLALIALSQEYQKAGAQDASYFQTLGTSFMAVRAHLTGLLLVVFFSLGALLFYFLLYRSKLVPRFIPVWGFIAVALVFTWNLIATFGIGLGAAMIFVLPIILNEIFLGIWLIVKGFNSSAVASGSATKQI
jgi:hypothetical protein